MCGWYCLVGWLCVVITLHHVCIRVMSGVVSFECLSHSDSFLLNLLQDLCTLIFPEHAGICNYYFHTSVVNSLSSLLHSNHFLAWGHFLSIPFLCNSSYTFGSKYMPQSMYCRWCTNPLHVFLLAPFFQGIVAVDRLSSLLTVPVRDLTGGQMISSLSTQLSPCLLGRLKTLSHTTVQGKKWV